MHSFATTVFISSIALLCITTGEAEQSTTSSRCTCIGTPSPEDGFNNADAVFAGLVISGSIEEDAHGEVVVDSSGQLVQPGFPCNLEGEEAQGCRVPTRLRYTFAVTHHWKGPSSSEITVSTGLGGGDCGYSFHLGISYLVYAYESPVGSGKFATNICTRTNRLSHRDAKEDLAFLDQLEP